MKWIKNYFNSLCLTKLKLFDISINHIRLETEIKIEFNQSKQSSLN